MMSILRYSRYHLGTIWIKIVVEVLFYPLLLCDTQYCSSLQTWRSFRVEKAKSFLVFAAKMGKRNYRKRREVNEDEENESGEEVSGLESLEERKEIQKLRKRQKGLSATELALGEALLPDIGSNALEQN